MSNISRDYCYWGFPDPAHIEADQGDRFSMAASNPKSHIGAVNTEFYVAPDAVSEGIETEYVGVDYVGFAETTKETIENLLKPTGMTLVELREAVLSIEEEDKETEGNQILNWLIQKVAKPIFNFIKENETFISTKAKLTSTVSSVKDTSEKATRHVKDLRRNPSQEVKRIGKAAVNALGKLPWIRQSIPAAKLFLLPIRKGTTTKTYEVEDLTQEYLKTLYADIKLTKNLIIKKGSTTLGVMNKLVSGTKFGMSIAHAAGAGLTTQAVAALSIITIVGSVLGLAIGSLGVIYNGHRLIQTGWKGTKLINIKIQAYKLRKQADKLEEKMADMSPDEKKLLEKYVKLYREESFLLHDFVKSQRREIATKAVRQTINVAANISLIAAGTSLVLSASGVGAPVCIPLSFAFSALAVALFFTSNSAWVSSWTAGKVADQLKQSKKSKIQKRKAESGTRRSSLGTGVAKSNIGISTRVAMLAKIEEELEKVPDGFFIQYDMKRPSAVKKYILDKYLEQDVREVLEANVAKRKKAKAEFYKEKAQDLLIISEGLLDTEDNITFDVLYDKLQELIANPPDEKKGMWSKLTSGRAYQEWIYHLEEDPIFNTEDYNIPTDTAA